MGSNYISTPISRVEHKASVRFSRGRKPVQQDWDIKRSNIVYIKVPKTGSSTSAGVIRRIAAHHGLNQTREHKYCCEWIDELGEPSVWAQHGEFSSGRYHERSFAYPTLSAVHKLKLPTFLCTIIREPADRAMSDYYYYHGTRSQLKGVEASLTTSSKIRFLKRMKNFQFNYIKPASHSAAVADVWSTFHFIGLSERFEESMVVLAATLRIPLSDVLYSVAKDSSKTSGFVRHPSLDEEAEEVQNFLATEFRQQNLLDYELYQKVNDTVTKKMSPPRMQTALHTFKAALVQAGDLCVDDASQEKAVRCYFRDEGCGYKCFDKKFDGKIPCDWCK